MIAHTLPTAAGARWLKDGFALYRRNPAGLTLLVVAYWFTIVFLNVLPILGALAASVAVPALSVGLMQAARDIERGEPVSLATLFGGVRAHLRSYIKLGLLYLVCVLGILGLSALIDGGDLLQAMTGGGAGPGPEDDFLLAATFVMLLMTPVLMAYWFAPVLVAWHGLPVKKALFFSFMACHMNWRPFLAYGFWLVLIGGILPGLVLGLLLALLPGGAPLTLILLALMLGLAPAVYASFYAGYRDIFGISDLA